MLNISSIRKLISYSRETPNPHHVILNQKWRKEKRDGIRWERIT
jgi:hypothetical protein